MPTPGCIVFDLDGTLIDSAPDINAIASATLATVGAAGISLAETHDFIGKGPGVFVSRMMAVRGLGDAPEIHAKLYSEFTERYMTATENTVLYPGVINALDAFARAGYHLGLCTNKPIAPTNAVLAHFGLIKYFRAVIGGDSLAQRKPDPAPLLHVFDQIGTTDTPRLYVGDSEVDADTASNARVPFALFTEGYRKTPVADVTHTYEFGDYSKFAAVVDGHFSQPTVD